MYNSTVYKENTKHFNQIKMITKAVQEHILCTYNIQILSDFFSVSGGTSIYFTTDVLVLSYFCFNTQFLSC